MAMQILSRNIGISRHVLKNNLWKTLTTHRDIDSQKLSESFRSHTCGELRLHSHLHQTVKLSGWIDAIRAFGPIMFMSIRDRYGITQAVLTKELLSDAQSVVSKLRPETVIQVTGKVEQRPSNQINSNLKTGEIEVVVETIEVLNSCVANLPLQVAQGSPIANEETRLTHRYLDLRRSTLQDNLRVRSEITLATRNFLCNKHGFLEIETPTLFKSTPEGAREFIVPTRKRNQFYALTQSPQQYKQLLMVGGLDRYFQLARCYRDEGGRADRQPEFTQIDLEMAFVSQNDIMVLIEDLVKNLWIDQGYSISPKFPRMRYAEAMSRYGVDKPDTRYGLELKDLTDIVKGSSMEKIFGLHEHPCNKVVRGINIKEFGSCSRKDMSMLLEVAHNKFGALKVHSSVIDKSQQAAQLFIVKIDSDHTWKSPLFPDLTRQLTDEEKNEICIRMDSASPGDIILLALGTFDATTTLLGQLRIYCANELLYKRGKLQNELSPTNFNHLWIIDFPLFELDEYEEDQGIEHTQTRQLSATHHPFTAPAESDLKILQELLNEISSSIQNNTIVDESLILRLLLLRAQHFDLVCNGWELGGGSIRIHNANLQEDVLAKVLKLSTMQLNSLQHLVNALKHGAPPHGGMALGLDRLVAILCGASSLRDVIAFPKSATGNDLMSCAPSEVSTDQLQEYHIQVIESTNVLEPKSAHKIEDEDL